MKKPVIKTQEDIISIVEEFGFLPFFHSAIPGFSIEECADPTVWFPPKGEGVWEWKEPVIEATGAAYGKFFLSRPCFVSKELFTILSAYRRDGYDFEGMTNDGLVTRSEKTIYSILEETGNEISTVLRYKTNMSKSTFDTSNTRLQMKTFIMISGFEYRIAKNGKPFGWGIARYALPEAIYPDFEKQIDRLHPKEAKKLLLEPFKTRFPETEESILMHLIG
ncbi:MAG: hypothetical protein IAA97_09030 [Spirochaetes bacterium]|uniref:Uncharacterized protein n=1 Tax=Candidatus Ornithospirochaeta stercoripullorum TaxID=2840899 RepID=A0A9D9H6M4_9SPIO|nr:hypothetical protein [Candidatus Ornithospirochaeta stercoripullorum]